MPNDTDSEKETRNKSMIIAIDGDYSTNWDIYIQNLNLIFKDKKIKILNFNKCILSFKKINNYFLNHLSDKDKLFGKITADATTGPAKHPLPASSQPATSALSGPPPYIPAPS